MIVIVLRDRGGLGRKDKGKGIRVVIVIVFVFGDRGELGKGRERVRTKAVDVVRDGKNAVQKFKV